MNNMLRYVVYILLFLLFTITVDQDHYTVEPTDLHPQTAISLDNPSTSKFKCIVRILTALSELKKQELQTNHIVCHTFHSLYTDAVDYYIYALRRIII